MLFVKLKDLTPSLGYVYHTADFIDWVRQKLPRKRQREIPSLTKLQQHISVERIIGEFAEAGDVQSEDLQDRKIKL